MKRANRAPRFSRGLYLETLRRTRTLGITLCALAIVPTLLLILPLILQGGTAVWYRYTGVINVEDIAPILLPFSLVAPALLVLQTFYYLNSRPASDLYHSLPHSRLCLGITQFAGAMTWVYGGITASLLLCAGLLPLTGMAFPFAMLGCMLVYHLVAASLVGASLFLGMAVAGHPVSMAAVSLAVLFLPRAALAIFRYVYVGAAGMLSLSDVSLFLSPRMHLPAATALYLVGYQGYLMPDASLPQLYANLPGILYSALLAMAFFALGLHLFKRRRSEQAGQAFAKPVTRYALLACGVFAFILFVLRDSGDVFSRTLTFNALGSAGLGAVMLIVYGLIYQRTWKSLRYTLPCLAIASALGLGLVYGSLAAGRHVQVSLPKAQDIATIRFAGRTGSMDPVEGQVVGNEWLIAQTGPLRYEDPQMIGLVAEGLAQTVAYAQNPGQFYTSSWERVSVDITLKGGGTLRRTLYLTESQHATMAQLMASSPAYSAAARTLPNELLLAIRPPDDNLLFTLQAKQAIWAALQADFAAMGDHAYVQSLLPPYASPQAFWHATTSVQHAELAPKLECFVFHGPRPYALTFTITEATPRAQAAYQKAVNDLGGEYALALRDKAVATRETASTPVGYGIRFPYTIEEGPTPQLDTATLSPMNTWEEYTWRYEVQGLPLPNRENFERQREAQDALVWDILSRATLAQPGDTQVIEANITIQTGSENPWTDPDLPYPYATAFFSLSQADYQTLVSLYRQSFANQP